MSIARRNLAAFALLVTMTAVTGATVFAAGTRDACAAEHQAIRHHECGEAAAAMKCDCCGESRPANESGTPAELRIQILRSAAIAPVAVSGGALVATVLSLPFEHPDPHGRHLLDRSIRFGVLLI